MRTWKSSTLPLFLPGKKVYKMMSEIDFQKIGGRSL